MAAGKRATKSRRKGKTKQVHKIPELATCPLSLQALNDYFPRYTAAMRRRFIDGAAYYGDKSFAKPTLKLIDEIQQELIDAPNWAMIGWIRLEKLKEHLLSNNVANRRTTAEDES